MISHFPQTPDRILPELTFILQEFGRKWQIMEKLKCTLLKELKRKRKHILSSLDKFKN